VLRIIYVHLGIRTEWRRFWKQWKDSLNAKFENLVLFCYDRLPEVKSKYESYKKMADREWNEFMELSDLRDSIKRDLNNIDSRLRSLDDLMSYVERKCNIIVDKRKEGNQ